ncbi:MAG: 4a-hydroxytetrahydrobiopterin dehydratase [Candidatus Cloacimonadota bacterium]|nr:MAG: 4a-hydroxytetrahydrobiopterin dehydratase [Candidatus Cloacimonadota bacterium]
MSDELLNKKQIIKQISEYTGWEFVEDENCIRKKFEFVDFITCWSVMSQIAMYAEKFNHHPDWVNVYNKLEIKLNTHDLGGVSTKDINLMKKIEVAVKNRANLDAYSI